MYYWGASKSDLVEVVAYAKVGLIWVVVCIVSVGCFSEHKTSSSSCFMIISKSF